MMELLTSADAWIALLSLTTLEIVLGIDNIVFIAILAARVPGPQQAIAYRLGLGAALITRLLLLFAISWVMGLTAPIFTLLDHTMSGRDLILLGGGLFLIGKATHEIWEKVEGEHDEAEVKGWSSSLPMVIFQIMLLDIVFSLDSVITAVGMVEQIEIMVAAMVIAVVIMLLFAKPVGDFVNAYPSMKILALAFLLLIGVLLTADGLGQHLDKRYVYFAMGFSLAVQLLDIRAQKKRQGAA